MVTIDKLKPGMKVARDVLNLNNAVLLTAGTELVPQHLRTLKMWGLDAIHVVGEAGDGDDQALTAQFAPEILTAAAKRVESRLKHASLDQPGVMMIRDLAVRRLAARLAQAKESGGAVP